MKRLFLVTGRPGIGKTSVLLNTAEGLKKRGYTIGGMLSSEVRGERGRLGFEIICYSSGRKGLLAHVDQPNGPQLGRYRVNLNDLDTIAAGSIRDAVLGSQIVLIDELGPMEFFSQVFKEAVVEAINSNKIILGSIHLRARDPLIHAIKRRDDAEIVEVIHENRDSLPNNLIRKITQSLRTRMIHK